MRNLDRLMYELETKNFSELLINNFQEVYWESSGRLTQTPTPFSSEQEYLQDIQCLLADHDLSISPRTPHVEFITRGTFRITVLHGDISMGKFPLSIRKMTPPQVPDQWMEELLGNFASFFPKAIENRKNILVAGGTGTGKTTLVMGLMKYIPPEERILTIEDTPELNACHPGILRLVSRGSNSEGIGEVRLDQLVRMSLRLRPDRIIVGEVRGGEIISFFQALNTGHQGSLTTIHANSARGAIERMITLFLLHQPNGTLEIANRMIRQTIDYVVMVTRENGQRKITSVQQVVGIEGSQILLEEIS